MAEPLIAHRHVPRFQRSTTGSSGDRRKNVSWNVRGDRAVPAPSVYHTAERPVETADIIIPVERYALVYQVPVR